MVSYEGANPVRTPTQRHKCSACFKQYKKKEHLIEHMRISYHSFHEPQCGVCKKHCKSFESLREHRMGPLPKDNCAKISTTRGCDLCLDIFKSTSARDAHKNSCRMLAASCNLTTIPFVGNISSSSMDNIDLNKVPQVVALDCEMVGGGSDGSLDLCASVCIIDEEENIIFYSYVIPQIPVTDYRSEITGITEEHLKNALPLKEVQEKVQEILYNGESIWRIRLEGGRARILVGHDLDNDLSCLLINYPDHLIRDTAKYRPLMKTNLISHSLKYLTRTYLGYEIQSGIHNPYEDAVAAMRLYKRMRAKIHQPAKAPSFNWSIDDPSKQKQLEEMTPDSLLEVSRSNYRCWCLDSQPTARS